jgi:cytochrome c551/c552
MKTVVLCVILLSAAAADARAQAGPAVTFNRKCIGCHTYGKGDLVGPDLKGATDRHPRAWLMAWISSSQSVIRSGDPAANALFQKYRQIPMPDQSFSSTELSALLDYLAAGGPEAESRRGVRRADTATAAEIEMGRTLFAGERALAAGGVSCASCHRAGTAAAGGSLGPDLTRAYARFQDKGLASLFARGCFPRVQQPLTDQESFALKAFLRQTETSQHVPDGSGSKSQR